MRPQFISKPTSIDLFCGAGGLSLGLKRAGFRPALAVDNWFPAQETFSYNFPAVPFLLADINQLDAQELLQNAGFHSDDRPTVIAGGPPCQGFSSAGRRGAQDPRNTLVGTFARLVAELRPAFLLFENVEGFLTSGRGDAVFALLDPLLEAGYHIHLRKVNAANYGVPQLRKRVIAVGSLGGTPSFPLPTHAAYGAPGANLAAKGLPRTPTLGETIGYTEHIYEQSDGQVREPLEGVDLDRSLALKPGQTMRNLPQALQHESYLRRASRRVRDGIPTERRGGPPASLRRLRLDEPSKAITGAAVNEFLHPSLHSFLTIRECARLQTFPDDFAFIGRRSELALLVGNAVPPRLAATLGRSMLCDYHNRQTGETVHARGRLLSFVPTLSTGMSPILTEVVDKIWKRYGIGSNNEVATQLSFDA